MVNVAENVWIWCGKITTGEGDAGRFKIPNSNDGWEGYWAPAQGTVLTSEWSNLSTNGTGDYKFCVAEEGIYKVTINTNTLKIKAEKLSEPTKDGDYYLLGGVADYYWYAGSVTSGENTLKARMTADLDFTTDGFFPLACDKFKFKGEFDGAGHTLSGINVIGANKNLGLCRYATGGTFIHHLLVDGSFTGEQKIAGLIGFARDGGEITLTNVVNKANVRATGDTNANASGFVGAAEDGTKIIATNCANLGNVIGQDGQCAAFAGWTQGGTTFTNCYNSGTISNMENNCNLYRNTGAVTPTNCYDATGVDSYTQGTKVDPALLATGELAFMLNGNADAGTWHQKLTDPKDAYPIPFGTAETLVYANGELHCDGTSKGSSVYSNVAGSTRDDHDFANGFCTYCDTYQPGFMTDNGSGIYEISTKYQMKWFSCLVNNENASANGQLMNDIDMTGITGYTPIGQAGHEFKGHFNGQGHRIQNLDLSGNAGYNKQGLFAETKDGAIIENLIMDATCTIKGVDYIAGILAYNSGNSVIVRNCGNEATVTGTGANAAGILGCSTSQVSITNCYNTGAVTGGRESAAICGWMGSNSSVIRNCFNSGTVAGQDGTNRMYRKGDAQAENLYDIDGVQATAFTDVDMASGQLAYLLNGSTDAGTWHQTLGTDANPVPFTTSNAVYGAKWDGTNTVYFNNEANVITAGNVVINDLCDNFNMPTGAVSVTAQKVSYSRANVAGFNTVCLPFALTSTMLPTGAKIYTTGDIGATSVKITEVTEVAAGQPCLVEFPADYTGTWDINIDAATPFALVPVNTGDLKGSYATTTIGAGKYKLNPEGTEFGITSDAAEVYPFRAYLEAGSGARGLSIIFGDETGINGVGAAAAAVEVYNAKGQRMQQLEKGVNIVRMANGQTRTVIVK